MERKDLKPIPYNANRALYGYKHIYPADQVDAVLDAYEARIKELEANQPKWISIKDMMPDELANVVLIDAMTGFQCVCHLEYDNELKKWWTDNDYSYPFIEFTHWMQLPKPPKEGK